MLELLRAEGSGEDQGIPLYTPRPIAISFSTPQRHGARESPNSSALKPPARRVYRPIAPQSSAPSHRPTSAGARMVTSSNHDPRNWHAMGTKPRGPANNSPFSPRQTLHESSQATSTGELSLTYVHDNEGNDHETLGGSSSFLKSVEKARSSLMTDAERSRPRPKSAGTQRRAGGRFTSVAGGWVAGAKGGGFRVQQDSSLTCHRCALLAAELDKLQRMNSGPYGSTPESRSKRKSQSPEHARSTRVGLVRSNSGRSGSPMAEINMQALIKLQKERDHFQQLYNELRNKELEVVEYHQMKEMNEDMEDVVETYKDKMHQMEIKMQKEQAESQQKIRKHNQMVSETQKREQEAHQRQSYEMNEILTALRMVELENERLRAEKGSADSRVIAVELILEEKNAEVDFKEAERYADTTQTARLNQRSLTLDNHDDVQMPWVKQLLRLEAEAISEALREVIKEKESEIEVQENQKTEMNQRIQDHQHEKGSLMNKLQEAQRYCSHTCFLKGFMGQQRMQLHAGRGEVWCVLTTLLGDPGFCRAIVTNRKKWELQPETDAKLPLMIRVSASLYISPLVLQAEDRMRLLEAQLLVAQTGLRRADQQRESLLENLDDQRLEADMQHVEAQKAQLKLMSDLSEASQISAGLKVDLGLYKEENEMLQKNWDESEDAMLEMMQQFGEGHGPRMKQKPGNHKLLLRRDSMLDSEGGLH